jgi:hypothetical protein
MSVPRPVCTHTRPPLPAITAALPNVNTRPAASRMDHPASLTAAGPSFTSETHSAFRLSALRSSRPGESYWALWKRSTGSGAGAIGPVAASRTASSVCMYVF